MCCSDRGSAYKIGLMQSDSFRLATDGDGAYRFGNDGLHGAC